MLRITIITAEKITTIKAEGKLVGPWVGELQRCWMLARGGNHAEPIRFDLTNVTFVDSQGKDLIREMCSNGAELHAAGPLMTSIVDEMQADLQRTQVRRIEEAS